MLFPDEVICYNADPEKKKWQFGIGKRKDFISRPFQGKWL